MSLPREELEVYANEIDTLPFSCCLGTEERALPLNIPSIAAFSSYLAAQSFWQM